MWKEDRHSWGIPTEACRLSERQSWKCQEANLPHPPTECNNLRPLDVESTGTRGAPKSGPSNDKLSCRAVTPRTCRPYKVNIPIVLAATRTTAAPC